jgi:hypothetical protein
MDMKCSKSKISEFALINGWLELYDRQNSKGSEMGYLLPDGSNIVVYFDIEALFIGMTDRLDISINLEDDND